jgi:hypothetical protein
MNEQYHEASVEVKREQLAALHRALAVVEEQRSLRDLPYKSARDLNPHFVGVAPIDDLDKRAGSLIAQIKKLEAELA